jgi:hypothetical protein
VDAAQTGLFNALPVAVAIPADLLASRFCWRFPYGPASRSLLPWLLLALDGSSVRGRGDEPSLDRGARRVRAVGENHSPRILGGRGCRAFPDGLGWLDGPFQAELRPGVRSMHWEIGLTFQCSGLICSVSQMKSGLLLRLSWVPYTGFLLHCSPIPNHAKYEQSSTSIRRSKLPRFGGDCPEGRAIAPIGSIRHDHTVQAGACHATESE